jgi:hypothetical protein
LGNVIGEEVDTFLCKSMRKEEKPGRSSFGSSFPENMSL